MIGKAGLGKTIADFSIADFRLLPVNQPASKTITILHMKKLLLVTAACVFLATLQAQPKKRADCFFGIHMDFHAGFGDSEIGKTFTAATIDSFLTIVKPDFVQVDCKGHPGYSSYPTKVGNQTGGYTKDILKIWREVTKKHNVALYVHYSGLKDIKAMHDHPDWARTAADGTHDTENAAYFGEYIDKLLIPQLKEISDYGINGAWVDGECWATYPDYSPALLEKFRQATGITNVPKSEADLNYKAFIEFNRSAFRQYLRKYVDAIHAYNPNFQITSNWSFSSLMPEPVDVNVDYLSGDVAGQNCVYNAAFQARCLALQGKPWDLMSWGFSYSFDGDGGIAGPKSLVQLQQEAAEVIAMGGGYQSYFTQNRDGSVKPWYFPLMAELGKFCRARQPFCKGAVAIPQIGLLYSTHSMRSQNDKIYGWNSKQLEGNLSMLMDGQHNVEILMDHQLIKNIQQYPLIVIPEWTGLDTALKSKVLQYVQQGGNVLVTGAEAAGEFKPELRVDFIGSPAKKNIYLGLNGRLTVTKASMQAVKPMAGTDTVGEFYSVDDLRFGTGYPVATITRFGKGKIAAVYVNLGEAYYTYMASGYVKVMNEIIARLMPKPLATVTGSDYMHTALNQKDGKWFVNIINTAGSHFNSKVYEYDNIPPTTPLTLTLNPGRPVKNAVLQPENKRLDFITKNGVVTVTVPPVKVSSIIQIGF